MDTIEALWGFIKAIFIGFGDLLGNFLGIPTILGIIILVCLVVIRILKNN